LPPSTCGRCDVGAARHARASCIEVALAARVDKAGIDFRFAQSYKGFNRRIGEVANHRISPTDELLDEAPGVALKARGCLATKMRSPSIR